MLRYSLNVELANELNKLKILNHETFRNTAACVSVHVDMQMFHDPQFSGVIAALSIVENATQ